VARPAETNAYGRLQVAQSRLAFGRLLGGRLGRIQLGARRGGVAECASGHHFEFGKVDFSNSGTNPKETACVVDECHLHNLRSDLTRELPRRRLAALNNCSTGWPRPGAQVVRGATIIAMKTLGPARLFPAANRAAPMAATILGAGRHPRRPGLSARRRGRRHALGHDPGRGHVGGRVPRLRLPVRPAALHLHHQQPRGVAQPAAPAGRGVAIGRLVAVQASTPSRWPSERARPRPCSASAGRWPRPGPSRKRRRSCSSGWRPRRPWTASGSGWTDAGRGEDDRRHGARRAAPHPGLAGGAAAFAGRRAGPLGPHARGHGHGPPQGGPRHGPPGPGRGLGRGARLRLGVAGPRRARAGSGRDAHPVGRGGPARPGDRPRPRRPGADQRRDRAPQRGPQDGPARLRLARPADPAGHDPGGGGQHARRVGGLDGAGPARGLPGDRLRGRANGPARPQPARPEPDRRRRPQAGARAVRPRRPGAPGGQARRRRHDQADLVELPDSLPPVWPISCT
jgi:hypothetical protein